MNKTAPPIPLSRYDKADQLEGMPGFSRSTFLLADAARDWMILAEVFKPWRRDAFDSCRTQAAKRYLILRKIRRVRSNP